MKNFKKTGVLFLGLLLSLTFVLFSCDKKSDEKKDLAKTEKSKDADEKKLEEPVSGEQIAHAFGIIVAKTIKDAHLDFDPNMLVKGYKDAMAEDFKKDDYMKAEMLLQRAFQEAQIRLMAENKAKSDKFLEENKKNEDVKVTESGLQYMVLKPGDRKMHPKEANTVLVNYVGKLMDGSVFDENPKNAGPIDIQISRVIPGWQEGIKLMSKGAKFRFFIPPELAYGEQGVSNGGQVVIPPNEVLTFDIELVDIKITEKSDKE